jgi:N-methylhydantoinase A/oxoprolinase/acetone carboxylase beta subunit
MPREEESVYHVGVDIGGTFTDCAVLDAGGAIATIAKSPSSRRDPAAGVLGALAVAAENLGQPQDAFLRDTALLLHGCTVATNAVVERSGVRTGLITTKGHEDALFIGKVIQKVAGLSEHEMLHQSRLAKAEPPIVERRLVIGVPERLDARGHVVVPLDLAAAEAALDALVAQGVEAVAVSFLWAFLDPRHEQAVGALARQKYPALYVALASDVAPVLGEYERTATAALSAYLGPPVLGYLERLADALRARGYQHELLLSHCMGGLTTVAEARARPLLTLDSGPAGGVLGARYFGDLYGEPNVLCTDMGGTTFDVSLVRAGAPELDEEPVVDKYHVLVPKIAIHSIGAGGGSILWVDPDGLLHVGPQSAGAEPGPACYGEGGEAATITDADLLLGYLNPARSSAAASRSIRPWRKRRWRAWRSDWGWTRSPRPRAPSAS